MFLMGVYLRPFLLVASIAYMIIHPSNSANLPESKNCGNTNCGDGEVCVTESVQCIRAPCPPIQTCMPQNATTEPFIQTQETTSPPYRSNVSELCSGVVCQAGYYCKETLFYMVLGEHHYKAECVANETLLASETTTQEPTTVQTSIPYINDVCKNVNCSPGTICTPKPFVYLHGEPIKFLGQCVNLTIITQETTIDYQESTSTTQQTTTYCDVIPTQPEDPCYTVDCASGFYCRDGECRDRCEVTKCATPCCFAGQCMPCCDPLNETSCEPGYYCSKGQCIDVCEMPEYKNKCTEDEVCKAGVCYSSCIDSNDCCDGYFCSNGYCLDLCSVTLCAINTTCVKGECIDLTTLESECSGTTEPGEPGKQVSCDEKKCPENYECYLDDSLCSSNTAPTPCQEAKCRRILFIDCISGYVPEGNKCIPEQCVGYYCSPGEECYLPYASSQSPSCRPTTPVGQDAQGKMRK